MPRLELYLLGPFQARLDGQPLTSFVTDKVRALLAYLAFHADRAHPREHLAGLLWSDQPESKALHSLRQAVSTLRKALDGDQPDGEHKRAGNESPASSIPFLLVERDSLQINPRSDFWLDVKAFQSHLQAALQHYQRATESCCLNVRRLQQAVALYQGEFLEKFFLNGSPLFEEWIAVQREALNHQMIDALARLVEYHERRGEYALACRAAQRLVTLAPWEENAHCEVMRLLAVDGQWSTALAQYATCRRYLIEQLGVDPAPETTRLFEDIRRASARNMPIPPLFPLAVHNLPPADTPFVGRSAELAELSERLADPTCRLITLLGPGGVGKTRLALEAAREQVGLWADGVYLVSLAAVPSPHLLPSALADALGFKFYSAEEPRTQIVNYLSDKHLLLALDNFEHLLAGADLLIDILKRAGGVKLLVTSRSPLNLRAESVIELEGLTYPLDARRLADSILRKDEDYSALQLFEQAARRVRSRFSLMAEVSAVTQICQLLEGLPLGIELSAAWVRVHDCQAIVAQIEQNLDFLATEMRDVPERHRSLRAVFEHSWRLLTPEEQLIFGRLSIFRGGFTVEAAGQVAGADALSLASLVGKSLLRKTSPERYDLHGLLQQFAAEKLDANPGEAIQICNRHSAFFAGFLADRAAALYSKAQKTILVQIAGEIDNLRAGWRWAVERGQFPEITRALPTLSRFYHMRSRFQEGFEICSSAVATLSHLPSSPEGGWALGLVQVYQGMFEEHLGNPQAARASIEIGLALLRRQGHPSEIAHALALLGRVLFGLGDYAQSKEMCEQGIAAIGPNGDPAARALLFDSLGDVSRLLGDFKSAQDQYRQAFALYTYMEDDWGLARACNSLGTLAGMQGEYGEAETCFQRALEIFRSLGDRSGTARILHNLSILSYLKGDYPATRQLRLECLDICKEIGFQWGITSTLKHLADVEKAMGEYEPARAHSEESLSFSERIGDRKGTVYALDSLGGLALVQKDLSLARQFYFRALTIAMEIGLTPVAVDLLCGIADVSINQNRLEQAVELLAFAVQHPAVDQQTHSKAEKLLAPLAAKLPEEAFAAWQKKGQQRTLEDIVLGLINGS